MVSTRRLVDYTNELLKTNQFKDYCPNGLQIEGRAEVGQIVSGVTASMALIEAAIARRADLLLVHHGYFWRGESESLTGMKFRRIQKLILNDINLLAYHLPLDAHPDLGNNAGLARVLGVESSIPMSADGVGNYAELGCSVTIDVLSRRLEQALGRAPLCVGRGPKEIRRIGWCTGGAQHMIAKAVELGLDAFISGEISEHTVHVACECNLHFIAAGHHATERFGVKSLGEHLAIQFGVDHEFVDINNPV